MLEIFLMSVGISLLYNFGKIKKKQGIDAELKELIESSDNSTGVALDIKNFLLESYRMTRMMLKSLVMSS